MKHIEITKFAGILGYVMGEHTAWVLAQNCIGFEDANTLTAEYANLADSAIIGHYVDLLGKSVPLSDEDMDGLQDALIAGFRRGVGAYLSFCEG